MWFKINKKDILEKLNKVAKAIETTNFNKDLTKMMFHLSNEKLIITGSNGYFSIQAEMNFLESEISEEKEFLIEPNYLINIIKNCDGIIEFKILENIIKISNLNDVFEFNIINNFYYPNIDFVLYGNKIKIDSKKFKEAIDNVIFASSNSNEEIILQGVNLKCEKNKLIFTATDNFRLARDEIEIENDDVVEFDITIANKNIKNFIPADLEDKIELWVNNEKINIFDSSIIYQSKIIDLPFKNTDRIFELNYEKELLINKDIFNEALEKATVINDSDLNKLKLFISNNGIKMNCVSVERGQTNICIDKNNFEYNNQEILIYINYKYLNEAINVFNDKIKISLNNHKSPILITDENSSKKQIISPMLN